MQPIPHVTILGVGAMGSVYASLFFEMNPAGVSFMAKENAPNGFKPRELSSTQTLRHSGCDAGRYVPAVGFDYRCLETPRPPGGLAGSGTSR